MQMLSKSPTLTSISEDDCELIKTDQTDFKPLNRQFLNEEFLNKISRNIQQEPFNQSILYSPTTNFKQLFRSSHLNLFHPSRALLWFNLLHQNPTRQQNKFQQAIERYHDDVRNMFGRRMEITVRLPPCVDATHLPYYYLNRRGQHAVLRILSIFAYYHPDVTYAPLLAPITSLFLHYMSEIDAYECLLILTSNDYKIITQTEIQYQSLTLAFRSLLRKHCRTTYDILFKQTQQNLIFDLWLWIIFEYLPLTYLIPIIDCLLIEDMKILIRISMTLYHFFVKYGLNQLNNSPIKCRRRDSLFRRTKSFRQSERIQRSILSSNKSTMTVLEDFISYIQHFDLPIEKLFKHAFAIHYLQRKEIYRAIEIEEEKIKSERRHVIPELRRSSSVGNQNALSAFTYSKSHLTRPIRHENSLPVIMVRELDTRTASHADFAYVWSLIPNRLADFQPDRIYSSNIHGRRLRTLYDHVEYHEHCLIIIRNEHDEVFGAFCSSPLANRTQTRTWFGTGESFLFTLKPKRQVFKWIGYNAITKGDTKPYEDYYIFANDDRIQIGGSKEPLNIGLVIDKDLNEGSTRKCDTFANSPLASSEHFQIMDIEVFGFMQ